jgi:hypothetical protein
MFSNHLLRRKSLENINWLDVIQWPALVVTVIAAWLVSSASKSRRNVGFWFFLTSNALWIIWGWGAHAYALMAMQFCLAVSNIHGVIKNKT